MSHLVYVHAHVNVVPVVHAARVKCITYADRPATRRAWEGKDAQPDHCLIGRVHLGRVQPLHTLSTLSLHPLASRGIGGKPFEYYHFLVDFAPRILYHLDRHRCARATLHVPGWWPALKIWGQAARIASMTQFYPFFFPGGRLALMTHQNTTALCSQPGYWLTFSQGPFSWSKQPVTWLRHLRNYAWVRANVLSNEHGRSSIACSSAGACDWDANGAWSLLCVDRRRKDGSMGRRQLPDEFFLQLAPFLARHRIDFFFSSLDRQPVIEQVRLFARSRIVVGAHGAGLTNMIFSPPRSTVIEVELACSYCGWNAHVNLAHRLGHYFYRHRNFVRVPLDHLDGSGINVTEELEQFLLFTARRYAHQRR